VLSAELVEVSARSSNRTVAAGLDGERRPGIGHLLTDGLDRLPPGHRLVSREGQHCLPLVESRHSRCAVSVEPLSDQPCTSSGCIAFAPPVISQPSLERAVPPSIFLPV